MEKIGEKEANVLKKRTKRSEKIFEEAKKWMPFGVNSNYRYLDPYPLYFSKGRGSRLWDADGNEYLDFNMAFGSLGIGHSHPVLVKAMRRRIENGTIFGFEGEDIAVLAKTICQRFKVDMVKLSSTGLESTMHAVRLARAYTQRKKILKFEGCYHGSHDTLMVNVKPSLAKTGKSTVPNIVPSSQGMLDEILQNTIVAQFNNIDSVEEAVKKDRDDLAGIILEPIPMNMGFVPPKPGFLEALRRLCDETGALLIFDEVKTCGKFYHGAEGEFGVTPDLKTMGKAIGGGYPLSVLGGKKKVMDAIVPGVVAHAGTFNSNPVAVTAGLVTLTKILTKEKLAYAAKLGGELADGYTDIINDAKLKAKVQSIGVSGTMHFTDHEVTDWRSFLDVNVGTWWTYYTAMLNRGVIPMATGPDEQWTVSVQHTKEDITTHLEAFKTVVRELLRSEVSMEMVEAI
ncbi:MAG TPA: aspartate aminotransferase family protein [Nitrososphaerales archaeon]|nr:aspartate aminotransferase family protein [Nitrososphaerales archaeon]